MTKELYECIKQGDSENVRRLLLEDPALTTATQRFPHLGFEPAIERDAYKFLGAYLGMLAFKQIWEFFISDTEMR